MISQLISQLTARVSQSSDSYGRTDGRTNEEAPTATLKSWTSVLRACIPNDLKLAVQTGGASRQPRGQAVTA